MYFLNWVKLVVTLLLCCSRYCLQHCKTSMKSQGQVSPVTYRKNVQPKPVDMINFDNPKPLRKKRRQRVLSSFVENDDGFDAAEALRSPKRICTSACILTKGDSDTASEDEDLPPVLSSFHEVEHESLSLEDKCQRFVRYFQELPQQVINLEEMTKGQRDSRRGRITATTAHYVLTLKQATTKSNVLKKIMKYNECDLSRLDALKLRNTKVNV
ncbi:hypothetical protein MAR_035698 [Mya arenaria]|uniref:Uncharacterized protein n=1 Tax=Mya arenaria TaxID=6604 RepID=A0ABY7ENM2_MYAAR|nr:hypothetical protein MAR_035698 [Mya arenaria]